MKNIVKFFVCFIATLIHSDAMAETKPKIKAVASFSILGDIVQHIGGDRIDLVVLVGPNSDGHIYEPTPLNAKQLANADILFTNGLHFEGWIERLIAATEFKGQLVVATQGISPLITASKEADPHAWQNLANARIYAKNIAAGLTAIDRSNSSFYNNNLNNYLKAIEATEQKIVAAVAKIPVENRKVITSHDAFTYFEAAYGLAFYAPQGLSTNAEASARDVAALVRQIRNEKVPAIFIENVTDPRLIEQIARETKVKIGGTLYSDALSEKNQPANTYLNLMLYNVTQLTEALTH